jgi:hypothetical protein
VRGIKASQRSFTARTSPATGTTILWVNEDTYVAGTTEDAELWIVEALRVVTKSIIDAERENQGVLPCDGSTMPAA